MRAFLAQNPGDGGGGSGRYRWADTGLDAAALRARAREYQERFAAWRTSLASSWRGDALSYAMVSTDESVARAVRRIVAPQARVEARR